MSRLSKLMKSSLGAKYVMAITGLVVVLWLISHMVGNLQVFGGPDMINAYAVWLRELGHGAVLWLARIGLLVAIVLHIASGLRLAALNRQARPIGYARYRTRAATVTGRTMALTGLIVLAYAIYHLGHFTFLATHPEFKTFTDAAGRHDVYRMVVTSFQNVPLAAMYIVANGLLCLHLWHGIASLFQSLGINHPKYTPLIRKGGPVLALVIFIGFAIVPMSVMAGWVTLAGGN